jgi:hypothetical protein
MRIIAFSPNLKTAYDVGYREGINSDDPEIPGDIPKGSPQAFEFARGFFAGQRKRIDKEYRRKTEVRSC